PEIVGIYTGFTSLFDLMNGYIYSGAVIIDVRNVTEPTVVGCLEGYSYLTSFTVLDDHVYLSGGDEEYEWPYWHSSYLNVYNVSSMDNPELVFSVSEQEHGYWDYGSMKAFDDLLVGLRIFDNCVFMDISEPSELRYIGEVNSHVTSDFTLIDNQLFVLTYRVFGCYDISNMNSVRLLGSLEIDGRRGKFEIYNQVAFIASRDSSLFLVDISDPGSMEIIIEYDLPNVISDLKVDGDNMFIIDELPHLVILDISDIESIDTVGIYDGYGEALDIVIDDTLAFLAADDFGLRIIDISDPEEPVEVSEFTGQGGVKHVSIAQELLCISCEDSTLTLLDVHHPDSIIVLSRFGTRYHATKTAISERYLYVIDLPQNLTIYNIHDPRNPTQPSTFGNQNFNNANSIAISGDYAYIGANNLLNIVNIHNPYEPRIERTIALRGCGTGIDIEGDLLFITDAPFNAQYYPSMWIFDISDPLTPRFVSNYAFPWEYAHRKTDLMDVEVRGDFAFIAGGDYGLRVLNVSNPRHPFEVGYYNDAPGRALAIAVTENYTLVANRWNLSILDCSEALDVIDYSPTIPEEFIFLEAYPNPFNNRTTISFYLSQPENVKLHIFDLDGRLVRDLTPSGRLPAGQHSIQFDAEDLTTGLYFVRLETTQSILSRKIVLMK
ncbi:MAG: T9SS type A sorting domain-containing protein, partial [Calditrichaeota bacterium]|nr:T9SS type A sorting domain-containing protein [Calditrichota bacterium]